jgi:hypothetical protein
VKSPKNYYNKKKNDEEYKEKQKIRNKLYYQSIKEMKEKILI